MEQKFECKLKLNQALEEKHISKEDYVWVIKHILKSNLLLMKHFELIKNYIDDMRYECNYLLGLDFFINDKILILWIARKLNHIIKRNEDISEELKWYLTYKKENMKDWNNKYYRKLNERTLISCDDGCFRVYLPISTRGITDKYSQFTEELQELSKNYVGNSEYKLNKDEINNIKEFIICKVNEEKLLSEINKIISSYVDTKDNRYSTIYDCGIQYKIIDIINRFENIDIRCNTNFTFSNFVDDIKYHDGNLYNLMKRNVFNYNVHDNFFIIDKNDIGEIIEVVSLNDILPLIDIPQWIKYMQSHDILDLSEMYYDKNYNI